MYRHLVYGGVPAKQIKLRFSKEVEEIISESHWWEHDEKWIERFAASLYE